MYSIEELTEIADKGILNLSIPEEPKRLYEPIRYTLASGGKRIRPVLVLAACNMYSNSVDKALYPAIAIELFHNFTLIHDDIMDKAPIRRNQPTVFAKWGSDIAILSGDALNILAYQLLAKSDKEILSQVINTFNKIALGVCDGQQYDMDFETAQYITQEEYLNMIELKTSVLLKGALQIGGIVAGAPQSDIIKLGEFGLNLGLAFQLQDDLLDAFGNSSTFGKKIGGDIVANKKTFLTIKAFSLAKGKSLELLSSYFKAEGVDPLQKVQEVLKIYNEVGVKEITEEKINEYFDNALSALDKMSVNGEKKVVLKSIAEKMMNRDR
ncbi:polyprenyl synthetase family protein [Perlabentimonas gracilis]|jgi:geranylgeranyl diphosphate synthase type II|uniref:polyprenyl synthetase family protein n=1 Tax=Perlabentimonas gracilis TaxID=2715279 RepID=UPI0014078784|nr:polyprenyl synthetase family protein [Perlabentimonas gracilis]NHB68048.1 polyprenyl synthetase family protein [Perlabentimonas gracilis]